MADFDMEINSDFLLIFCWAQRTYFLLVFANPRFAGRVTDAKWEPDTTLKVCLPSLETVLFKFIPSFVESRKPSRFWKSDGNSDNRGLGLRMKVGYRLWRNTILRNLPSC